MARTVPSGIVYFVGAGPGHPGLITLRGMECLRRADVVLYDYLANPQILQHAPPDAELVCLGRHGRLPVWSQDSINAEMVKRAQEGHTVVRLKGGDPLVFGRMTEEIRAVRAAQLAYEIVPGITAASAAAAFTGLTLTDREHASAVALVTGHEQVEKEASALNYPALASFPGTLIFYMGVQTTRNWSEALMAAGKPADTPVAAVRRASWPDQQTVRSTLGELASMVEAQGLRPPVVFVVGEAARHLDTQHWFGHLPLLGKRIVVTRPERQAQTITQRLGELGAQVFLQPTIEIAPPASWTDLDDALDRLGDFAWIVFSSVNGVEAFFGRLQARGEDARRLASARLAAIGARTAESLANHRLQADLVPDTYRAEALATALAPLVNDQQVLLVRASRGREVLAEQLTAAGAEVHQVVAYQSLDVEQLAPSLQEQLAGPGIDWITVTSSAIARSLSRLFAGHLGGAKLASISPITSQTLREAGLEPTVEAQEYTTEGVIEAILRAEQA